MEKKVEKYLKDKIEIDCKGLCVKLVPFAFTGLPDRLCLLPGARLVFVETKSAGKQLKPRQKYVHEQLAKLGFTVLKIDSKEQVDDLVKTLK